MDPMDPMASHPGGLDQAAAGACDEESSDQHDQLDRLDQLEIQRERSIIPPHLLVQLSDV